MNGRPRDFAPHHTARRSTRGARLAFVGLLVLSSCLVGARSGAAPAQAATPRSLPAVSDGSAAPATPTRRADQDPNAPANVARVEASAAPVTIIVRLADPALSLYGGGVAGYAATAPARGARLQTATPDAVSYRSYLAGRQGSISAEIRALARSAREVARYDVLINALAVSVPGTALRAIRRLPGVTGVWLSKTYHPTLNTSVGLIDVPALWNSPLIGSAASAGAGIKIADIDTGIEITNTMFNPAGFTMPPGFPHCDIPSNCAYTNNKVIVARAYPRGQNLSAQDFVGHGTATASIEAGVLTTADPGGLPLQGVAPAAYLMNYNVFPAGATGASDVTIMQAVQDAVTDGANVLNLSLGGPASDLGLDPLEQSLSAATAGGIPVSVSAGNDGPSAQTVGSPGDDPAIVSSGASTNSHQIDVGPTVALTTSASYTATVPLTLTSIASQNSDSSVITQSVVATLALAPPDAANANAPVGCSSFPAASMTGAIALIERGSCAFSTKITNAQAAGAVAVVIWDNRVEIPFVMSVPGTSIPAVMISQADGQNLVEYATSVAPARPNLALSLPFAFFPFATAPNVLSSFSSTGPGPGNEIKPDVTAPGQGIVTAAQNIQPGPSEYDPSGFLPQFDGTSAAAPHTAGVMALLRQVHPDWTPAQIKSALMNTANSAVYVDNAHTITATVQQQGAGLVDAYAAATAPVLVQPASLTFPQVNVSAGSPISESAVLTVTNVSTATQTLTLGVAQTVSDPGLTLTSSPSTLTIPVSGTAQVTVTAAISGAAPNAYEGAITVMTANTVSLHVPYYLVTTNMRVTPGSVLLVDDFSAQFQGRGGAPGFFNLGRPNYASYYTQTLTDLGVPFTLWDENVLGSPSLSDLQSAAAVIYYTGDNQGQYNLQGSPAAVSAIDQTTLDQYVSGGGRLFITGSGVGSAPGANSDFLQKVLHTGFVQNSIYDGPNAPPLAQYQFGNPPTDPSMSGVSGDPIASGLTLDIGTLAGDGAGVCCIDNQAIGDTVGATTVLSVGGVTELAPLSGTTTYTDTLLTVTGHATPLFTVPASVTGATTGVVATRDSFAPSLEQPSGYTGRSVYFGFGFEGINNPGTFPNSTGTASRDQVMANVLSWLSDAPTASISAPVQNATVQATAALTATDLISTPASVISSTRWDFGDGSPVISTTASTQSHTYSASGSYIVRVQVTDARGHTALASTPLVIAVPTSTPTAAPTNTATATPTPTSTATTAPAPTSTSAAPTPTSTATTVPAPTSTSAAPTPTSIPVVIAAPALTSASAAPAPPPANTPTSTPTNTPTSSSTSASTAAMPSSTSTSGPTAATTLVPTNTPIAGGNATRHAPPATQTATSQPSATTVPAATETATALPIITMSNKPATVKGGRSKACDLKKNLRKVEQGCEIIASISAPHARVVYTIAYPGAHGLRQAFTDTADRRGHSLHVFAVPYLPPVGAKHGSLTTVARVTITATLTDGTDLQPEGMRFVVVR